MRLFTLTLALTCVLFVALCSASAIPASAYARALDIRDATPVVARRASPSPSPSPRPHADRLEALEALVREPRVPTRGKLVRRNVDDELVLSPAQLSGHLCPRPMSVCPITSTAPPRTLGQWIREGFECVDTHEDLTSCGGCGILDKKYDCTAINGARTVSCVVGTCQINSCRSGYSLSLDGTSCVRTEWLP